MEFYDEEDFSFRFRFTKASVIAIMSELQLKKNTDRRGTLLPPLLKVLITLRFYGTGAMQTVVGDLVRVSQQYVSRCVWEITQVICLRLFPKYVRLPDAADANAVMARFCAIALFLGVTGCIDCTHVPIVNPGGENAEVFRNRKGYFSLNVQAITGPELQFFDVVASWPGSVHDSRIFTNSRVMALYEQKAVPGVLFGDQGYNNSQIKTRNSVERTYGVWKRRFACLRVKLLTDTDRSAAIITACAALRNIACLRRYPCPLSDEAHPEVNLPDNPSQGDPDTVAGAEVRSCYICRCFSSENEYTGPVQT
nr:putative nuclease HARBI1 isoform X2 [Rhipicephalus microplus]